MFVQILLALTLTVADARVLGSPKPAPLMKLRGGGVSAGDVAFYGSMALNTMVGVPGLLAPEEFFKGNFPGEAWVEFKKKCSPEAYENLLLMTRFFAGAVTLSSLQTYVSKGVVDDKTFYSLMAFGQAVFAILQIFFAAKVSVLPKTNYIYAGVNVAIAAAAIMAMM